MPFGPDGDPLDQQGRHLTVAKLALEDVMRQLEEAQKLTGYDGGDLDRLLERAHLHTCIAFEEISRVDEQW